MFKKKPTEAPVTEEKPVVQPVKTEEISPEEESEEETQETEQTDEQPTLESALINHEQRLQQLEAALFRLKGAI